MKNGNKEIRLVYRTLDDPFFIINKPVNWTLKKKNAKTKNISDCNDFYKEYVKEKNEPYKNALKKLDLVEKNAFLFTNTTSLCYNNLSFPLIQNSWKQTNGENKEKENVHKNWGHNKFVESYFAEPLLKNETNNELFYPYKLPLYMSGLVICCSDYFIYKKFVQLLEENKVIKKYRCLIYNPWIFFCNSIHLFATDNGKKSFDENAYRNSLETKEKAQSHLELMKWPTDVRNKNTKDKNHTKEKEKERRNKRNTKKKEEVTAYINTLMAQKKVNKLFPYHNFYDNSSISKDYWNYLTDLEIHKWKNELTSSIKKKDMNINDHHSLGRKIKITKPLVWNKCEENREKKEIPKNHFVRVSLQKSEPVKCLNSVFTVLFNDGICNEHTEWEKITNANHEKEHKKAKETMEQLLVSSLCNLSFGKVRISHKNKVTFPLSLFFNEGIFYRLNEAKQTRLWTYSMIYTMCNYKTYLQSKKLWSQQKHEHLASLFENVFLVDFILLDRVNPDMIRFFFSEMKTPIINDAIFDTNNFKKDIINYTILKTDQRRGDSGPLVDIFKNESTQNCDHSFNVNRESGTFEEDEVANPIRNVNHSIRMAFSFPHSNDLKCSTTEEQRIQLNNYFIHESEKPKEPVSSEDEATMKSNNICIELYQLQFRDPINNEYVKIENSLPSEWF